MSKTNYPDIKKRARQLRKDSTEAEKLLWGYLRNRKLLNHKFLRQHPIVYKADYKGLKYFIADFYCHSKKVVIELDGLIHNEQQDYDQFRDEEMNLLGISVLRLKNEKLTVINSVLEKIKHFLKNL